MGPDLVFTTVGADAATRDASRHTRRPARGPRRPWECFTGLVRLNEHPCGVLQLFFERLDHGGGIEAVDEAVIEGR